MSDTTACKTTFLKLLSGIITPFAGTARVLGHVPWERADAFRRRFALVMGQRNQLWWDLPAVESFRLHQEIYRLDPARFAQTRNELVEMLGVGGLVLRPDREWLERLGFPCELDGPRAVVRIDRTRIADVLPELLRAAGVRDVSVEDVPLEELVADLFRSAEPPSVAAEAVR